ncbi:MAG: DUF2510 domain-containing protein [Coriobacteriales bacterium]|jgi:hypothetical protein|nr:DUF2510 domain-containing protein [Coriobacteriales bacterium]
MIDQQTPAGWYPDPSGSSRQRYWDGAQWTEQYRDAAQATGAPGTPPRSATYSATVISSASTAPPQGANSSMVLGIVSLVICLAGFCIPFSGTISVVTGIIGAVMGVNANKIAKSPQATAGIVLSIISLSLSLLGIILAIVGTLFFSSLIQASSFYS